MTHLPAANDHSVEIIHDVFLFNQVGHSNFPTSVFDWFDQVDVMFQLKRRTNKIG